MKNCQKILTLAAIFSTIFVSSGSVFALANSDILAKGGNSENLNNHQKENRFNQIYQGDCDVNNNLPHCR